MTESFKTKKTMKRQFLFALLNCALVCLIGPLCAAGQESDVDLKDKKITIRMEHQSLRTIFKVLMTDYDVPIGFEESVLDREHDDYGFWTNLTKEIPKQNSVGTDVEVNAKAKIQVSITIEEVFEIKEHWISVNAKNERLGNVLDSIVEQMENYEWEINDGVVNIFPIRGRDEKYQKLLDLNIKDFKLRLPGHIWLIKARLCSLPEFKRFIEENQLYHSCSVSGGFVDEIMRPLPGEMNFSNLTLKGLLNKITRIKRGGWILKHHHSPDKREGFNIDV